MISVTTAKELICAQIFPLSSVVKPIDDAVGFVLTADILSPINVPAFLQSSMDGYAFSFEGVQPNSSLTITAIVQAGDANKHKIATTEAVRIFTGAPLPEGADTVLMQEKAIVDGNNLTFVDIDFKKGTNARPIGADINKGAIALKKGTVLSPAAIGFLASIGITEVEVINKPSINIILTGNELQDIGQELHFGQIYESNSHTLLAALKQLGIVKVTIEKVTDSLEAITNSIHKSLEHYDLTLMTGGVSVGDYDFVLEATKVNQVTQIFHKIKQKPGKPLFLGKKENKIICGLPGNPASVLSCFYNYVTLILDQLSGTQTVLLNKQALLTNAYKKPAGLTHFLKGLYDATNNKATILDGQESFKMNSFALANCFIELPETVSDVNINEEVLIHLFPR
jgi:molybdopterin molybdotransferase